jgi:hypothetical protein
VAFEPAAGLLEVAYYDLSSHILKSIAVMFAGLIAVLLSLLAVEDEGKR